MVTSLNWCQFTIFRINTLNILKYDTMLHVHGFYFFVAADCNLKDWKLFHFISDKGVAE